MDTRSSAGEESDVRRQEIGDGNRDTVGSE
jgi:hypothetical protein